MHKSNTISRLFFGRFWTPKWFQDLCLLNESSMLSMCTSCWNFMFPASLIPLFVKTETLAPWKQKKCSRGRSFLHIRQFTPEVKLALKCSFNFGSCCIKCHSKSHPKTIQHLYRIHDRICPHCEIDSEFILRGWREIKISQVVLRSLTDIVVGGTRISSSGKHVHYPLLGLWASSLSAPAVTASGHYEKLKMIWKCTLHALGYTIPYYTLLYYFRLCYIIFHCTILQTAKYLSYYFTRPRSGTLTCVVRVARDTSSTLAWQKLMICQKSL